VETTGHLSIGPYAALDHDFVVEAHESVAASIERLLAALRAPNGVAPTTYRIEPVEGSKEYGLWRDGACLGTAADARAGIELLFWAIDSAAVRDADRLVLVHAGAAELDGRVVVVPGPSGSGKSTLVAALVRLGWRFVTDEIVAIDPTNGALIAYPRAAKVESPVSDLLDLAPFQPEPGAAQGTSIVPLPGGAPSAVAMVVAPSVRPDAAAELVPMRTAETISTLAAATWNLQRHRQRGLDVLASMARQQCVRVELGDPIAVAAAINGAIENGRVALETTEDV
jgi:hypothetical protein